MKYYTCTLPIFGSILYILFLFSPAYAQTFATPQNNPFSLSYQGQRSCPAFADLDNDNDLDMLVGIVSGNFGLFSNTGNPTVPVFSSFTLDPFSLTPMSGNATPFLVDLDNDNDFDIISGGSSGLHYFENIGNASSASFGAPVANPFSILSPSGISNPCFVDIDDDTDLDLFVGASDGNIYYYQNTGSVSSPAFATSITNPFGFSDKGSRSAPAFSDLDNDGDYDALVGMQDGSLYFYKNTGTKSSPAFTYIGIDPSNIQDIGQDSKPYFADLDNDGDDDLMIGTAFGDYIYHENTAPPSGLANAADPKITIFPNPLGKWSSLRLQGLVGIDCDVVIYDYTGKMILYQQVAEQTEVLDILAGDLNSGAYMLCVRSRGRLLTVHCFIVQ